MPSFDKLFIPCICIFSNRSYRFVFEYQVNRSDWDIVMPYNGKTVSQVLDNVPFIFKF